MAEKRYLFTPGPTPVPPEVLAMMAEQVVHHRGPDFKRDYEQCLARLQEVCRTEHDVLLSVPLNAANPVRRDFVEPLAGTS